MGPRAVSPACSRGGPRRPRLDLYRDLTTRPGGPASTPNSRSSSSRGSSPSTGSWRPGTPCARCSSTTARRWWRATWWPRHGPAVRRVRRVRDRRRRPPSGSPAPGRGRRRRPPTTRRPRPDRGRRRGITRTRGEPRRSSPSSRASTTTRTSGPCSATPPRSGWPASSSTRRAPIRSTAGRSGCRSGMSSTFPFARLVPWPAGLDQVRAAGFLVAALAPRPPADGGIPAVGLAEARARLAVRGRRPAWRCSSGPRARA